MPCNDLIPFYAAPTNLQAKLNFWGSSGGKMREKDMAEK
jgi:hypothetical protein